MISFISAVVALIPKSLASLSMVAEYRSRVMSDSPLPTTVKVTLARIPGPDVVGTGVSVKKK